MRCPRHWGRAYRDACLAGAKLIYLARTWREAVRRFKAWKARWEAVEPKAVACLAQDIEQLLVCFDLPQAHRSKVRTTNAIERSFREVRRRTNPMSCFNNTASIDRIIFPVLAHLNANWEKHPIKEFTQKT